MKIQHLSRGSEKINFYGKRDDRKTVIDLKTGIAPILDNKKRNLLTSLYNLTQKPNPSDIDLLFEVADDLNYGLSDNSEFTNAFSQATNLPAKRENMKWSEILDKTIRVAIENCTENEAKTKYTERLAQNASTIKPLTDDEKSILSLREELIESVLNGNTDITDTETITDSANIVRDIDYFIASSEISKQQKKTCLEKMKYFLSDDYKINPVLKDKKFQALREILNDMLIKTPEDDVLRIKEVDQRESGICAAISICRKALAYEDKVQYMDIILNELSNDENMEVYDITQLGTGKKVKVKKPEIDYETALKKGYRIIDTSAHIWMQMAGTVGNGELLIEEYTAFDKDNYGLFQDSRWYETLSNEYRPEQNLLRILIKEREIIESLKDTADSIKRTQVEIGEHKQKHTNTLIKTEVQIRKYLKDVYKNKTDNEISLATKDLLNYINGTDNEGNANIPAKISEVTKKEYIFDHLKEIFPSSTKEELNELKSKIPSIFSLSEEYTHSKKTLEKLRQPNYLKSKFSMYKRLFKLAAAHRIAIEKDLDTEEGFKRNLIILNMPVRDEQISEHLSTLNKKDFSEQEIKKFSKALKTEVTPLTLKLKIAEDKQQIDNVIPAKADEILSKLAMGSRKAIISLFYSNMLNAINAGDKTYLTQISELANIPENKKSVSKYLEKSINLMQSNPTNKDIHEAERILGFDGDIDLVTKFFDTYIDNFKNGVSEQEYKEYYNAMGKPVDMQKAVEKNYKELTNISNKYKNIQKRWSVPTTKELMLKKLENSGEIVSRKVLDQYQNKFDEISHQKFENSKIKNLKERNRKDNELYKFTKDEILFFNQIKKKVPDMRKYANTLYKSINENLKEEFEAMYGDIGKLQGQFWIWEEGSSGLATNQSVRIFEQMTGKPYKIEYNAIKGAEQIKEGEGSGIISTSVSDTEHAWHAQYIESITSEKILNPETKKRKRQDVLWHDNSWGNVEKEGSWYGDDGYDHTGYNGDYGWKKGYILSDDNTTGTTVEDLNSARGFSEKYKEHFGLFHNMILPGTSNHTIPKIYETFSRIFEINKTEDDIARLEKSIKSGKRINPEEIEQVDDIAYKAVAKYEKRVEKELTSKDAYNKLPKDDILKFYLQKLSLYMSAPQNEKVKEIIIETDTPQKLHAAKQNIFEEHLKVFDQFFNKSYSTVEYIYASTYEDINTAISETIAKYGIKLSNEEITNISSNLFDLPTGNNHNGSLTDLEKLIMNRIQDYMPKVINNEECSNELTDKIKEIVLKSIDEDIRIKNLDSPRIKNFPNFNMIEKTINKYLEPQNDEEFLELLKELQEAPYETFDKFLDALDYEDVGMDLFEPYDYVIQLNADNEKVEKAFSDIITWDVIDKKLPQYNSAADAYRNLYVDLCDLDVNRYIKEFKAEAFTKYQARPAYPQNVVYSDEEIEESITKLLETVSKLSFDLTNQKGLHQLTNEANKLFNLVKSNNQLNALLNDGKQVTRKTESLIKHFNEFTKGLVNLHELIKNDESFNDVTESIEFILNGLQSGQITDKEISSNYQIIKQTFDDLASSGITEKSYLTAEKNISDELKAAIQIYANSSINPKYKNDFINAIQKWIKLAKNKPDSEEEKNAQAKVIDITIDRHISKTPTDLLKTYTKLLQTPHHNKTEEQILKAYLEKACKTAKLAKIEYRLIKNAHEGFVSKTSSLLNLFSVTLNDGSKHNLDSEMGMLYLVAQLGNPNDNNSTLKLFLTQTGLTDRAVDALINNFNLESIIELTHDSIYSITNKLKRCSQLNKITKQYFENSSQLKYNSFDNAKTHFISYIRNNFKDSDNENDKNLVENFVQYIEQVCSQNSFNNISPNVYRDVLNSISENGLQYMFEKINTEIDSLNDIKKTIVENLKQIGSIPINPNSPISEKRNKFFSDANKMYDKINEEFEIFNKYLVQINEETYN